MDKLSRALLVLVLILFSLYLPLDNSSYVPWDFKTIIDDFIPLWTPFVVIYLSYFLLLAVTCFYFIHNKLISELKVGLLGITISTVAAYVTYLFFQSEVVRPIIENRNIFDFLYLKLNDFVKPYNAFPSLHVAISAICALGYWRAKSRLFQPMLFWIILIIFSTVLTKQHYFLDVAAGIVLAIFSFNISSSLLGKYSKMR